ncbi:MAG: TonB C-terminal domain-containing protein [Sulfurimonas sp.]|nr:TonB C-terminal domain-containing protein [Sulfurimonas sp.]
MADNNSYFYISGFISISIFLFFSFMLLNMMFLTPKVKVYALKKDTYISISMKTPDLKTTSIKNTPKVQDVSVNDLFSDVWTKKISKKKKPKKTIDKKRLQEISKKSKKLDIQSEKIISTNMDNSKSEKLKKSSTANEVNEYLAKIQAIVYENFNPPPNSEGHNVKAVIELTSFGKLIDFRILVYSQNSSLNNECDKIKQRLESVLFPSSLNNKSFRATINLIPENKEQM